MIEQLSILRIRHAVTPRRSNASHVIRRHFHSCYPALPQLHALLRMLLRILRRRLVKLRPIILEHFCCTRLHRIIWNRLNQQVLRCRQHAQDLAAWFPSLGLEDTDAHAAMFVEGHIRVPDSRLEVDLGRLERVVGGEDE